MWYKRSCLELICSILVSKIWFWLLYLSCVHKYLTSITISKKQYEYAKQRIHKCGLNEKVNIQIKDYRDLKDKYNSIASIEMIEAVGKNYLQNYVIL